MNEGGPSRRGTEEGSVAVEIGITIPALLLLILGSVEFGRVLWTYNTMLLAVEDAGRYAMVYDHSTPGACPAQIQAPDCPALSNTPLANCSAERAQQVLSAYQAPDIGVSVEEDTAASPGTITICTSYSFEFPAAELLPYGPLNLTSRVTVPLI